jgi:TM2 domain-containing membrane protein YozV
LHKDASVFDLGELDARPPFATTGSTGRPARFRSSSPSFPAAFQAVETVPRGAGFLTSLSIFLPGAGQVLLGEIASGLFFLTSIGFLGALGWALLASIDRLTRTLDLFGVPTAATLVTLLTIYVLMAILHLCAVLHAHSLVPRPSRPGHPVLMALASLLVPGWGQLRNGCYGKGTVFMASLWLLAAAGILVSGALTVFAQVTPLDTMVHALWFRVLLLTVAAVVWALAVYDAAAFARIHRSR